MQPFKWYKSSPDGWKYTLKIYLKWTCQSDLCSNRINNKILKDVEKVSSHDKREDNGEHI